MVQITKQKTFIERTSAAKIIASFKQTLQINIHPTIIRAISLTGSKLIRAGMARVHALLVCHVIGPSIPRACLGLVVKERFSSTIYENVNASLDIVLIVIYSDINSVQQLGRLKSRTNV